MENAWNSRAKKILLYILIILIPFQLYFTVHSNKHLTVALVLSFLLLLLNIKDIKFLFEDDSIKIYILFLLAIGIRGIFSKDKLEGLKYILYLGSGLVYYFVYLRSQVNKENIVLTLTLATLPMVFLMIYTYHNEKYEFTILRYPIMKLFIEPDTLQECLAVIIYPNIHYSNRVGGFFINANICSLFLGLIFSLIFITFIYSKSLFKKILLSISLILFLISIIYTGSAGAIYSFVISFSISGIIFLIKKIQGVYRKILFFIFVLFFSISIGRLLLKSNPRLIQMQKSEDFHGRELIWKASWKVIKNVWFFGVGLSGKEWAEKYNPIAKEIGATENMPPHNMFLYIWGRAGIISSVLFALFFIVKIFTSIKNFYLNNNLYSIAVVIATLWFLTQGMVENFPLMELRISAIYWLILSLEKNK